MPSSYTFGSHYEDFVQSQLENGHYNSASEVVRAGLRLLEERNDRLCSLDRALAQGLKDGDAVGCVPRRRSLTSWKPGTLCRRRRDADEGSPYCKGRGRPDLSPIT